MMTMTQLTMTTGAMAPLTQTEDPTNPDLSTQALKRDEAPRERREYVSEEAPTWPKGENVLSDWLDHFGRIYRIVKL